MLTRSPYHFITRPHLSWIQAVRGCVLEGDADAAARGVFDGLFGLVVEVFGLQAATQGGVRWVYGTTEPPVRQEDVAAVHAAHDRGQHRVDENAEGGAGGWEEDSERDQGRRCARLLTQEKRVQGRGEVFANVSGR